MCVEWRGLRRSQAAPLGGSECQLHLDGRPAAIAVVVTAATLREELDGVLERGLQLRIEPGHLLQCAVVRGCHGPALRLGVEYRVSNRLGERLDLVQERLKLEGMVEGLTHDQGR